MSLQASIEAIGRELVTCTRDCEGVSCNRKPGQIPRCLFLERGGSAKGGAIVVGVNPGRATEKERNYYVVRHSTYAATVEWFENEGNTHGREHPYYVHLRHLLRAIGLGGPIVWTELAKCESAKGVASVPLQTFRRCSGSFLQRELAIPQIQKWPLFGVGLEAFKALAYLFPRRTVIGCHIQQAAGGTSRVYSIDATHERRP